MTGGTAYLRDGGGVAAALNTDTVVAETIAAGDDDQLLGLLRAHRASTGSNGAAAILSGHLAVLTRFVKVQARSI